MLIPVQRQNVYRGTDKEGRSVQECLRLGGQKGHVGEGFRQSLVQPREGEHGGAIHEGTSECPTCRPLVLLLVTPHPVESPGMKLQRCSCVGYVLKEMSVGGE